MFEIEKNIPPPACRVMRKHPFKDMEVGDSVLVTGSVVDVAAAINACNAIKYSKGFKFSRRRQGDESVRFWRIE